MADDERPDPMQAFYLGQRPEPPDEEPVSVESRTPLPPLAPIRIRWMGLLIVVAFVLLLAVVARVVGSLAAQVLAVVALLGLAATTIVSRRRHRVPDGEGVWWQLPAEGVPQSGDMDWDGGFDGDAGGGDPRFPTKPFEVSDSPDFVLIDRAEVRYPSDFEGAPAGPLALGHYHIEWLRTYFAHGGAGPEFQRLAGRASFSLSESQRIENEAIADYP